MSAIRVDMTVSLDGYVAGLQDARDAPMGIGGFRLFNWLDRRNDQDANGQRPAAGNRPLRHRCR